MLSLDYCNFFSKRKGSSHKIIFNESILQVIIPQNFKCLLENESLIFAGRSVQGDINRITKLGVNTNAILDLRSLALNHDPLLGRKSGTSLSNLWKKYLELDLMKIPQISDYSIENLSESLI